MSKGEEMLALHLKAAGVPEPEREYRFCTRRWRFDFAWPAMQVAAEVEGGTQWGRSRHSKGKGFENDANKYNTAQIMGWKVYRFSTGMVDDGTALDTILKALGG